MLAAAAAVVRRGVTIMRSKLLCVLAATLAFFGAAPQATADIIEVDVTV